VLAVVLGGAITLAACKKKEPVRFEIRDLVADYDANEVAAGQKYRGQLADMAGRVGDVVASEDGDIVTLEAAYSAEADPPDLLDGRIQRARCVARKSERAAVAKLEKGTSVSLIGELEGVTHERAEARITVRLRDCTIGPPRANRAPTVAAGAGAATDVEITFVAGDRKELDCAHASLVNGLYCRFEAPNGAPRAQADEAKLLQPFTTVTGQQILAAGFWQNPAVAKRCEGPAKRATAKCTLRLEGRAPGASLRWSASSPWEKAVADVAVGVLHSCTAE
jgi:hypothetical protein